MTTDRFQTVQTDIMKKCRYHVRVIFQEIPVPKHTIP